MTEEMKDDISQPFIRLGNYITRLKQENEMLTRENENRNDWIISLNKKCEELIKEKLNYRSALEEIKNIILTYESKEWNCFNDMNIKLEEISKVINEVLNPS